MNSISSLAQSLRFRFGLRITSRRQVAQTAGRFFFRAVMVSAVIVMVATNQDLAERVQIMEAVTEIYEAKVSAMEACESGKSRGYHYPETGKLFECMGKL